MTAPPDIAGLARIARTEGRFRYAPSGAGLWHFPAAAPGPGAWVLAEAAWDTGGAALSLRRLARAARQDIWRALAGTRGFWPVVGVEIAGSRLRMVAGGRVAHAVPGLGARIAAVIGNGRAQWTAYAARTAPGDGATGDGECSRRS